MQNYYIPCAQQDRSDGPQHGHESRQSFFRRSSASNRQLSQQSSWTTSDSQNQFQTPSLGHSSSSSPSQDECSPRTPQSSGDDSYTSSQEKESTVSRQISNKTSAESHNETQPKQEAEWNSFLKVGSLPSRPKSSLKYDQQQQVIGQNEKYDNGCRQSVPAKILEPAVRSRLARPSTVADVALQPGCTTAGKKPAAVVTFNSRCHSRRRPCNTATAVAPPKLKRDTDCTDAIVRLIVCFSTKLVHAIWSESATTPKASGAFHGAGVLPLRVFIQETLRRSKTSYSTLQVALFYLILLKPFVGKYHSAQDGSTPSCRALQCGRRMFLTALILASKYLQDRNYSSRAWSKISGLPISEINENERRYLTLIQFNLHMKKETFENWSKIVLTLCKVGESSMNQDLAQESSRSRIAEMVGTIKGASDDEAKPGSDKWWTRQLSHLTAELVQNQKDTEEYLVSLTEHKGTSVFESESLLASLDSPSSSPDSIVDLSSDKILRRTAIEMGSQFVSHRTPDVNSSPASVDSLPSRPDLPNLPTPQTTPRYTRMLPLPKGICQMSSRCKDSSQALLGIDKQALNIANLETCPPPQPRTQDFARLNGSVRREGSGLASSVFATTFSSSPESITSELSSTTTRSRSSSMSSNSSVWWPSGFQMTSETQSTRLSSARRENTKPTFPGAIPEAIVPASYSFYHTGHIATMKTFEDEAIGLSKHFSEHSSCDASTVPKFQDEVYGSDELVELVENPNHITGSKAIQSKVTLQSHRDSLSTCPAVATQRTVTSIASISDQVSTRKHKRDRSSASEDILHHHVRQLLWNEQPSIEVMNTSNNWAQTKEKQLQYPVRDWACLKKPVSNDMRTKRFALYQDNEPYSVDIASRFSREDTAMVS